MAKYKLLDFHRCQIQLWFFSKSKSHLKPLTSTKLDKFFIPEAEIIKFYFPKVLSTQKYNTVGWGGIKKRYSILKRLYCKKKSTYWGSEFLTPSPKKHTQYKHKITCCIHHTFCKGSGIWKQGWESFPVPLVTTQRFSSPTSASTAPTQCQNLPNMLWPVCSLGSATEPAQSWFLGATIKLLYTPPACALGVVPRQKETHIFGLKHIPLPWMEK